MKRPPQISLGHCMLPTPVFFPSISSVKTAMRPEEYLAALISLQALKPKLLVSAYDLSRFDDGLRSLLNDALQSGITVLMDSGNYESYWKEAKNEWKQKSFHEVLNRNPCSFAFGFDEQEPPADLDEHVEMVVSRWREDQDAAGSGRVIVPIVHGHQSELPAICERVTRMTPSPMVAVAERRLGDGIIERIQTVQAIRTSLNTAGRYVGLHLLGTGNPISIALYSWAGADSFDGLEWCQTAVDHDTGLLHHLSQGDFFVQQAMSNAMDMSFHSRTLAHNIIFYSDWMRRLRSAVHEDKEIDFFRFNFPERVFRLCQAEFGW